MRKNILFQDNTYSLFCNETGLFLETKQHRFKLYGHGYEPLVCINDIDSGKEVVWHDSFDLTFVVEDFSKGDFTQYRGVHVTKKQFCEAMENWWCKTYGYVSNCD